MNGGAGERRKGRCVTEATVKVASVSRSARDRAADSSRTVTVPDAVSCPASSKSRPVASGTSSTATSAASKLFGAPFSTSPVTANVPSTPHHDAERKRMRDRSRSTTMRVATLWTRPAESRGMTFFQRTGDTS